MIRETGEVHVRVKEGEEEGVCFPYVFQGESDTVQKDSSSMVRGETLRI